MNKSIYLIPIFVILFIFTNGFNASAQCPSGDVIFTSQQDVDNFAVNYPNCNQLPLLRIGTGGTPSDINDLSPLSQIIFVSTLQVTNNLLLTDLDGLQNLFFISGDLTIANNPNLVDISALSGLEYLQIVLEITNNASLPNLNGLENIRDVSTIYIKDNPLLTDLTDLSNITALNELHILSNDALASLEGLGNLTGASYIYITGNNSLISLNSLQSLVTVGAIDVSSNPNLINLSGLENIDFFARGIISENNALEDLNGLQNLTGVGDLKISANQSLTDLSGLDNLTRVNGKLQISDNNMLENLNGLQSVTRIDELIISSNQSLMDLFGLENVQFISDIDILNNNNLQNVNALANVDFLSIINLRVQNNANLSVCYAQSICNYLMYFDDAQISNNASGCDSPQEVQSSCISLPVELTRFTAEVQRGSVLLTWQTASETNNQGFDIQRSKDGINWEKVGYRQGAGNSIATQDYRYNDTQPLSGINYYRLKQMDVEGDFIYSDVVSVSYGNKGFAVFPVPAKDALTLQLENPQTAVQIRISNIIGEVIHTQDLQLSEGVNQFTFDISEYTKGIYFLTMNNGDKNGTQRFVKH